MSPWIAQPMSLAQSKFDKFLAVSGCSDLPCLLDKTTEDIVSIAAQSIRGDLPFLMYAPTADGVELTSHPWVLLSEGQVADVPILHGSNRDEIAMFAPLPKGANLTQLEKYWVSMPVFYEYIYSDIDVDKLEELYLQQVYPPVVGDTQEWWAGEHSTGDVFFGCPARYTATKLAEFQASGQRKSNQYLYNFQHPRHSMNYVTHFSEVPYVFNWGYTGFRREKEDQDMSDVMTAYWGNFIIDNNPSSGSVDYSVVEKLPIWAPFSQVKEETIQLPSKEGVNIANGIKQSECEFLIPLVDKTLRAAFA
jgi:carboxylesterase type B